MNGADLYPGRNHISVSSLTTASRCSRLSFYEATLQDPRNLDVPFAFGRAIHYAAPTALVKGLEEGMRLFDQVWEDPPEEEDRDPKRNRDRAEAMLGDLVTKHQEGDAQFTLIPPPPNVVSPNPEVSPYELSFTIDIGLPIPFHGRLDSLVEDAYGDIRVWELKTSSEVSNRLIDDLAVHPEPTGYCWALREVGIKVKGAAITVLRVSPSRTETVTQLVDKQDHHLDAFGEWARWVGGQMLMNERAQEWPRNLAACSSLPSHGHPGWVCPFQDLCHQVGDWTELAESFPRKKNV